MSIHDAFLSEVTEQNGTHKLQIRCKTGLHRSQSPNSNTFSMLFYVQKDHKDYLGRGAQDGHLDFHTALELCKYKYWCGSMYIFHLYYMDIISTNMN